ncbi:hypothetical protein QJS10_CPA06g00548 [Acorus calamus]|uniref:Uncharacterized protein n=1 Tax=Acorus calamus TaxID=4465 RepID=A0AAV9EPI0_ACOCL|nr:hypothetical protein QJS10_CPA06g00548 [Acorus calamus]
MRSCGKRSRAVDHGSIASDVAQWADNTLFKGSDGDRTPDTPPKGGYTHHLGERGEV